MARVPTLLVVVFVCLAACAPAGPARTDRVRIFDDPSKPEKEWGYDPPRIRVPAGTTVTFTNAGAVYHTVTADTARLILPLPTSPTPTAGGRAFDVAANPGERVAILFDQPGMWPYHCGIHPDMKGVVEVCDGACP